MGKVPVLSQSLASRRQRPGDLSIEIYAGGTRAGNRDLFYFKIINVEMCIFILRL